MKPTLSTSPDSYYSSITETCLRREVSVSSILIWHTVTRLGEPSNFDVAPKHVFVFTIEARTIHGLLLQTIFSSNLDIALLLAVAEQGLVAHSLCDVSS